MKQSFLFLLLGAAVVGCQPHLVVPTSAIVACATDVDCPSGRICAVDVGICLSPGDNCVKNSGGVFRAEADGTECSVAGSPGSCRQGLCTKALCGDGFIDAAYGETCDDGAANSDAPDACRTDCSMPRCGDGVVDVQHGEVCDDHNTTSGDGCTADCKKIEVCGDGIVDANEECDDANDNDNDGCASCREMTWQPTVLVGYGPGAGDPLAAALAYPTAVSIDPLGNIFVGDSRRLWRYDAGAQRLSVFAGNGEAPPGNWPQEGIAPLTPLLYAANVVVDTAGNVFFRSGYMVQRVDARNDLTLYAGNGNPCNGAVPACGDGGPALDADLTASDLALDGIGDLYIGDHLRVRRVDHLTDKISTVAGTGEACAAPGDSCGDNGAATGATFVQVGSIAFDSQENLFISDNFRIRRIDSKSGMITTWVGNGTSCGTDVCNEGADARTVALPGMGQMRFDAADNLYFAEYESGSNRPRVLRRIDAADFTLHTVAGSTSGCVGADPCGDGGPASLATLGWISDFDFDPDGRIVLVDIEAPRVRRIENDGSISTILGSGGVLTSIDGLSGTSISGVAPALDASGQLVSSDGAFVYSIDGSTKTARVLGVPGDGGIIAVAVDSSDNVFFIDDYNQIVERLDSVSGATTVIAGAGADPGATDSQLLALYAPQSLAMNHDGRLLIADTGFHKILSVDLTSCDATNGWHCSVEPVAGSGGLDYNGDDIAATAANIECPLGVTEGGDGSIYIADAWNCRVRQVDTNGIIHTVAKPYGDADCVTGSLPDGCDITGFPYDLPYVFGVAVDASGTVYYSDLDGQVVHQVRSGIDTIALGDGAQASYGDGDLGSAAALNFPGLLSLHGRTLYVDEFGSGRVRAFDLDGQIITTALGNVDGWPAGLQEVSKVGGVYGLVPAADGAGYLISTGAVGQVRRLDLDHHRLDAVMGYPNGLDDTKAAPARFVRLLADAAGLALDPADGALFVSERKAGRLRRLFMPDAKDPSTWQSTVFGPTDVLVEPRGLAFDAAARVLLVADAGAHVVYGLPVETPQKGFSIVAGSLGHQGYVGDGGPALAASLDAPSGVALGPEGEVCITDSAAHRVRCVDSAGNIDTVLGDGVPASSGTGKPAVLFPVDSPESLWFDGFGNLFITSRTALRLIIPNGTGIAGLQQGTVRTIYGAYPRSEFPDSVTSCLSAVTVAQDDASIVLGDSCNGFVVEVRRVPAH